MQPQAFDDLIRPNRDRRWYLSGAGLSLARILLIILVALLALWAPVSWLYNAHFQAEVAQEAMEQARAGTPEAKDKLAAARWYNKRLAASGQRSFGEVEFDKHSKKNYPSEDRGSALDDEYQALLSSDTDVMAVVRIPKISVKRPIYHGTTQDTLSKGAGHLYGSSLPVGGKLTNAVITAHRGMPDKLFFHTSGGVGPRRSHQD